MRPSPRRRSRAFGNERVNDFLLGTLKIIPSAAAHEKATGAVHTYAWYNNYFLVRARSVDSSFGTRSSGQIFRSRMGFDCRSVLELLLLLTYSDRSNDGS